MPSSGTLFLTFCPWSAFLAIAAQARCPNQLTSCLFLHDFWQLLNLISGLFRVTTIYIFCKTSPIPVLSQSQDSPKVVPDFELFSSTASPRVVLSQSQKSPRTVLLFGNFFIVGCFSALKTRFKSVQNQNGLIWKNLGRAKN